MHKTVYSTKVYLLILVFCCICYNICCGSKNGSVSRDKSCTVFSSEKQNMHEIPVSTRHIRKFTSSNSQHLLMDYGEKMYINSAYLNNSLIDRKDNSKPLIVTMCGTYRLYTKQKLPTWRPRGRLDFQLLYIASGKAHFHFGDGDEDTIVQAGHMVLL